MCPHLFPMCSTAEPATFSLHVKALQDAPASFTHTMKRYMSFIALSMEAADGQTLGREKQRKPSRILLRSEAIKV